MLGMENMILFEISLGTSYNCLGKYLEINKISMSYYYLYDKEVLLGDGIKF